MASTISWQTTGPLVGTPLTHQGIAGVLTHYIPSCADSRRPELWKWNDSVVLLKDNINKGVVVAVKSSKVHLSVIQERLDMVVEHFLQREILPMCVLLAVMEESWSTFLSTANLSNTVSSLDRPLYYTTTSIPPPEEPTGCSVSAILARIKAGFGLAHQYHEAHVLYLLQQENSNNTFHRRSTRGPPLIPPTRPLVWQKGGRVAQFLFEYTLPDSATAFVAPPAPKKAPKQVPTQKKTLLIKKEQRTKQPASTASNGVESIDAFSQIESSEDNDDDDDEEFNAPSEDEDEDEELQDVMHERVALSHDSYDTEEKDPSEEDDDDSTDYILSNPHLQPTTILSYLGKRAKTLSMADLLGAIHSSRAKWTVRDEDDLLIKDAQLRLETTTKYTKAEALQCKYLLVPVEAELPSNEADTCSAKQWAVWRFKGIYSGYTVWPSWSAYVNEWRRQQPPQPMTAPKIMQEEEFISIPDDTRRSGRRSASIATTGVYYGVQSSMSHKQLLQTVLRLCGQVSWHTMHSLEALVGDDALTRLMTAVTTLVYKRRQVLLLPVNSIGSDEGVWGNGPLMRGLEDESTAEVPAEDAEPPPVEKERRAQDNRSTEDSKPSVDEETNEQNGDSNPAPNDDIGDTKLALRRIDAITSYIHELHQTELQLRYLILRHLRSIPDVATAAEERSMEEIKDPTWLATGHEYLGKEIFRPGMNSGSTCKWWKIQDFCPAIPLEEPQDEDFLVARRAKFRAFSSETSETIILTEGQVEAGMQAAEMKRRSDLSGHPLAGGAGIKMTFRPNGDGDDLHCTMAGHSTVVTEKGQLDYRVLVMPDSKDKTTVAVWLSIKTEADGSLACMPISGSTKSTYTLLQSDYDHGSPAFEACRTIIEYLKLHPRAEIFMNPVDPVALGIPTYFTIVKRPMDISTLEANLEKGLYSTIVTPTGKTAVARMLNGPFKQDALLIFDNAILFNPPDDWIHLTAASIRKALLKKIEQASYDADNHPRRGGNKQQYLDLDSDVDMYEDEDDKDMPRRKQRVDVPSGAMMVPLRLQNLLTEPLRGPFARLPISSDPSTFSLTPEWSCRHKMSEELPPEMKRRQEILELQRLVEEEEKSSIRRSARSSHGTDDGKIFKKKSLTLQYYRTGDTLPPLPDKDGIITFTATSRKKVEGMLEAAHETYYAKLCKLLSKKLFSETGYGIYANDSFPPYLGRVVPNNRTNDCVWEIRSTYVVPAIRWVLRGLIQSGHFSAMESMSAMEGGVIFPNDVLYVDKSVPSFGVLAEGKKRKRENADEESEEEIELSTYEQMRAERVARNAERLKALGLG